MYYGVMKYIPDVCSKAERKGNHFECSVSCDLGSHDKYICPCFGKNSSGWIPVSDERIEELKQNVIRWNDCRKKIPYKKDKNYEGDYTPWMLRGIKFLKINKFNLNIESFLISDDEKVKKEMIKLFNNNERIGFNEDWGVGSIFDNRDDTYTVEKWYYGSKSNPVVNGSLDDVIIWLHNFWNNSEPFSYEKAERNIWR